jgi:ABC-2 type transport system ATP-binding protein
MSAVIEAHDLARWYGEVVALSGLELEIDSGVTGLLGANGAGKSTLLKVLTGSLRPNRGAVRILGQPVWDNPSLWRRVGFCPESESVYEDWSVREFLHAMCALSGVRGAEAASRVDHALHLVGLEPPPAKSMAAFSKGMRQRAKLAQALLFDPEVLLLDEPLNGMDPVGRTRTMDLIAEFGRQGRTVLVSSHILPEVESMTRNVALLDRGKLVASGDVAEIRDLIEDRPQSVRLRCHDPHGLAARFIGLPDVEGVRFAADPQVLVIETRRAESFYARLTELGADRTTGIIELLPLDADLRSVYEYLIR